MERHTTIDDFEMCSFYTLWIIKGVVCSGYTFLSPFLYNNKKFASPVQYIVVTLSINKHLTLVRHFNYNGKSSEKG